MKIGIVTVYDAVTNVGSYLQAFAMKTALEELGHDVIFVEKESCWSSIAKCAFRLHPKRSFFLRLKRCLNYLTALKEFSLLHQEALPSSDVELLLYGSDEIWNMDNPYFKDELFFGTGVELPKIAYAVSMGAMDKTTLLENMDIAWGINEFKHILVRDSRTRMLVREITGRDEPIVCDPTLLISPSLFRLPCKLPKNKYLLIYTYGVDEPLQECIKSYAKKHGLLIVSAFFWHHWCDQTIECSPLEFSYLIENADCVFTSTFHGAIFTMLNHKRCCIYPARSKVTDVVSRFGVREKLINFSISQEHFDAVMDSGFPVEQFEELLQQSRSYSWRLLKGALKCLEN